MAGFSFRSNTTMHMFILDEKFINFICSYTQHVDIRLIYPHRITGTQSPIFVSFFKHVCMLLPALSMQSKTLSVIVCALWFMFLPMLFFLLTIRKRSVMELTCAQPDNTGNPQVTYM